MVLPSSRKSRKEDWYQKLSVCIPLTLIQGLEKLYKGSFPSLLAICDLEEDIKIRTIYLITNKTTELLGFSL